MLTIRISSHCAQNSLADLNRHLRICLNLTGEDRAFVINRCTSDWSLYRTNGIDTTGKRRLIRSNIVHIWSNSRRLVLPEPSVAITITLPEACGFKEVAVYLPCASAITILVVPFGNVTATCAPAAISPDAVTVPSGFETAFTNGDAGAGVSLPPSPLPPPPPASPAAPATHEQRPIQGAVHHQQ